MKNIFFYRAEHRLEYQKKSYKTYARGVVLKGSETRTIGYAKEKKINSFRSAVLERNVED